MTAATQISKKMMTSEWGNARFFLVSRVSM